MKPLEQEKNNEIDIMLRFSNLTIKTAVAIRSEAMEADTIFKNGVNLKSLTSRENKLMSV